MVVSIIGSGPSGRDWFNTPTDLSIGCNDAAKWGKDPDWLVIVNRSFPKDREAVIKATRPKKVFTTIEYWKKHFREVSENLRLQQFGKHLRKGHVYCSKTSPFIAMSLAFNAHATDIILFGCDLRTHPVIKGKLLNYELRQWQRFCAILKGYGVNVWVSSEESKLSEFLPVWKKEQMLKEVDEMANTIKVIRDNQLVFLKK